MSKLQNNTINDVNNLFLQLDATAFITIFTNMIKTCLEVGGQPRLGGQIGCCAGNGNIQWYDSPLWNPEGFKLGIQFYVEATGNPWDPYLLKIRRITSTKKGGSVPLNPDPLHPDNQATMTQFAKELIQISVDSIPKNIVCANKVFKVVVKCDKNDHTVTTVSPNPFVPPFLND